MNRHSRMLQDRVQAFPLHESPNRVGRRSRRRDNGPVREFPEAGKRVGNPVDHEKKESLNNGQRFQGCPVKESRGFADRLKHNQEPVNRENEGPEK